MSNYCTTFLKANLKGDWKDRDIELINKYLKGMTNWVWEFYLDEDDYFKSIDDTLEINWCGNGVFYWFFDDFFHYVLEDEKDLDKDCGGITKREYKELIKSMRENKLTVIINAKCDGEAESWAALVEFKPKGKTDVIVKILKEEPIEQYSDESEDK